MARKMGAVRASGAPNAAVLAWAIALFVLLGLCLAPLLLGGVDLNRLSRSSSVPAVAVFAIVGILLSAYTPTFAAALIAGLWPAAGGIRRLLRQVLRWRANFAWYLLALLGPIPLLVLAVGLHAVTTRIAPHFSVVLPSSSALGFFVGSLIAGSVGEEFGWRGFALPRLQGRYGALWASVIIGLLWSTWHLWPVVTPGGISSSTWSDVSSTYVRLIATSIIYTWIYNNTGGSLLLVMLAHAGHNVASTIVQVPADGAVVVPIIIALLYLLAAMGVVLCTRPGTLMSWRNRLPPEAVEGPNASTASVG
jgi:uncharacterized protein